MKLIVLLLLQLGLAVAQPDYRKALRWLHVAGFHSGSLSDIEEMSMAEAEQEMRGPLLQMKRWYGLPGSMILDPDTERLMSKPRCANKDVDSKSAFSFRHKRYSQLGNQIWRVLPVTLGFKNYWNGPMSQAVQEDVAIECARKWAQVSGLSFRFVRNQVANVYIEFNSIEGDGGKWGIVGIAQAPTPDRVPPSSYVRMDSRESWIPRQSSGQNGISLEEGLCHEIGHAIGLGHSGDSNAIMYPTVGGRNQDTRLGDDDIKGVQFLYGSSNGLEIVQVDSTQTTKRATPQTTPRTQTTRTTTPKSTRTTIRTQTTKSITTAKPKIEATNRPFYDVCKQLRGEQLEACKKYIKPFRPYYRFTG